MVVQHGNTRYGNSYLVSVFCVDVVLQCFDGQFSQIPWLDFNQVRDLCLEYPIGRQRRSIFVYLGGLGLTSMNILSTASGVRDCAMLGSSVLQMPIV